MEIFSSEVGGRQCGKQSAVFCHRDLEEINQVPRSRAQEQGLLHPEDFGRTTGRLRNGCSSRSIDCPHRWVSG